MKIFAAIIIVSGLWLVLAFALAGCGRRKASAPVDAESPAWHRLHAESWMWEQHETVVSLGQHVAIPRGHPVSRVMPRPGG
jgi:hypothetical protein